MMKLNEGRPGSQNLIRAYDADGITVGTQRFALPVLVEAQGVDTALASTNARELTAADIERVCARQPALVLAGSASGPWHAPAAVRREFETRHIAFETMDLGAACRTFNVLLQEDREVVALLLP